MGEEVACTYLKNNGYRIIARNYRCPEGEIDIVCTQGEVLVFVEVKTRTNLLYGYPEEAVTKKKRSTIRKVSRRYLQEHPGYYDEIRFDVLSVLVHNEQVSVNHIEAAF